MAPRWWKCLVCGAIGSYVDYWDHFTERDGIIRCLTRLRERETEPLSLF